MPFKAFNLVVGLLATMLFSAEAAAVSLDAKKLASIEVRGISLQTVPSEIGATLSSYEFESVSPQGDATPGVQNYRRVDPLLGDVETFAITQDATGILRISYSHTYPKSNHPKGSWKQYVHASEIEYALTLLCDSSAVDKRDCKNPNVYSPELQEVLVEARRVGDFQQKYIVSFRGTHAGYSWDMWRGSMNE